MSANAAPLPNSPGPFPVEIPQVPESSSLWDRITTWASEHKGTVYAIAGVTLVVTAAGTIYYLSESNKDTSAPGAPSSTNKRKTKRDRKKAKERAEKEAAKEEVKAGMNGAGSGGENRADIIVEPKKASVAPAAAEDELPEVDENSVQSLTEEVQ